MRRNGRSKYLPVRLISYPPSAGESRVEVAPSPLLGAAETRRIRARPRRLAGFGVQLRGLTSAQAGTDHLSITLPVPPSINHQYATVNGRRVMTAAGRAYKVHVGQLIMAALSGLPHRPRLLDHMRTSPLTLTIRFFFASANRRDVDGGLKIAQDAICGGLGVNDNRIVEIHLYKRQDRGNPHMEISLAPLSPPFASE